MHQLPTKFEVRRRQNFGFSVNPPGDLDIDLLTSNLVRIIAVGWVTFLPILVFLGLFVLDLWSNTCQTYHVTLRP